MKKLIIISLMSFLVFVVAAPVYSELKDRGGGLIYDSGRNITWLQDANMGGFQNWYDALAWADSLVFGGFEDWRLPSAVPSPGGVNIITYDWTASEMGHLYYTELGNTAAYGGPAPPINPGPFTNLPNAFWSGTGANGPFAWGFNFSGGGQNGGIASSNLLGSWAVRDGDVIPHTYCVSTSAELQNALNVAATNSTPDIIRIRSSVDPYVGNFVYTSTEPFGLTIEGGYNSDCSARVDPTNTVLDGDNTGRVLTLDCSGVAADLVVDGLTMKNGNITGNGGGVLVLTNQGNALLKNNVIKNNSIGTGSGGGVYLSGNEMVDLISNHIEGNSSWTGGGVTICEARSINMTENTVIDNHVSGQIGIGGVSIGSDGCGATPPELVNFSNNIVSNNTSDGDVGGILIKGNGATITVDNNTITNNTAQTEAGGKIRGTGVVVFTNNIVSENIGIGGFGIGGSGGIRITSDEEVRVKDNFIIGNSAGPMWGFGGITITGAITINLTNNIICNNSGETAPGGVHIDFPSISSESVLTVTNNTICQNTSADYGGGIKIDLENEAQSANIYNNIIWGNFAALGSDLYIKNGTPSPVILYNNNFTDAYIQDSSSVDSQNNINADPQFDIDGYHLTASSPCIDAGVDAGVYDDIDGHTRPQGAGYDIGADEYVISDSDGDGIPDDQDACPNSDLSETVVIDGWDTGVGNVLIVDGCTISDLISECADKADNHGEFVSAVSHTTNSLKKEGIISGKDKGRIQKGAAKAAIP